MQKTLGKLGFMLPIQTLSASQELTLTPAEVLAWSKQLAVVELGNTAKKVYHALCDCNQVNLPVKDRFHILEILYPPLQLICQSLKKHYIQQSAVLSAQQQSIADLAQTLELEMADGYKLVLEHATDLQDPEFLNSCIPIVLEKILEQLSHVILMHYQLYSKVPSGIWKEIYLLYQYAEKNQYLKKNNLENNYKRILLLAATDPYQWPQNEEELLYQATELWATFTSLDTALPSTPQPSQLFIDLRQDAAPFFLRRTTSEYSEPCQTLLLNPLLEHLKNLLSIIEPNPLQAKISHAREPEYAISSATLRKIIQEWSAPKTRAYDRISCNEPVQVSIGLIATHFYLNARRPFQSTGNASLGSIPSQNIEIEQLSSPTANAEPTPDKLSAYPLFPCVLVSEDPNSGYEVRWLAAEYPSLQAGDILGISKDKDPEKHYEVYSIRRLLHPTPEIFSMGVERLSKTAKAAAIQLLKDGKPLGQYSRCLLFENTILVPILPFKSGNRVAILKDDNTLIELELKKLIDSSTSYNLFQFITKSTAPEKIHSPTSLSMTPLSLDAQNEKSTPRDNFDSLWSKL